MIYPNPIKKGDVIGVTAPSDGAGSPKDIGAIESAIQQLKHLGYGVYLTDSVYRSENGKSADGMTRAREFEEVYEKEEITTVISAAGGFYLIEMLSHLDFSKVIKNPKWFQGFSDNTTLCYILATNYDMASLYSYNFSTFGMEPWHKSIQYNIDILEGNDITQHSFDMYQDGFIKKVTGREEFELHKEVHWRNISNSSEEVVMKGRMLGGCLDVLLNLVGTKYDKTKEFVEKYKEDKILWYLESYDLGGEALMKGLWQLKEAGWFEHASGFIFGRPTFYNTFTGLTYDQSVLSVLGELNVPVVLDADIGHKPPQLTIINGSIGEVRSYQGKGSIKFERR